MTVMYWGTVFCPTDIPGCWCWAKVRPWPYWWLRALWLFVRIVWRPLDFGIRLDWKAAWDVAFMSSGMLPCKTRRGRPPDDIDEKIWPEGAKP